MAHRWSKVERKRVRAWRRKLLVLSRSVKDKNPRLALAKLLALDIAMLESAIYSLCSHDEGFTQNLVEHTLFDIFSARDNSWHWRNTEAHIERDELEREGLL
ncbi:MAG: hypothetical protein WCD70_13435 [Alphaproteobacteria bacterium]